MGLTIYTGCMYSGKTTRLLKAIMREVDFHNDLWKETLYVYNHFLDSGAKDGIIRNHSGMSFPAKSISGLGSEFEKLKQVRHLRLFINELQFFDPDIIGHIKDILKNNNGFIEIYGCGLDLNSFGNPFPVMAELLCLADKVVKLRGDCAYKVKSIIKTHPEPYITPDGTKLYDSLLLEKEVENTCHNDATRTQRLVKSNAIILPQDKGQKFYEPRCLEHFTPS